MRGRPAAQQRIDLAGDPQGFRVKIGLGRREPGEVVERHAQRAGDADCRGDGRVGRLALLDLPDVLFRDAGSVSNVLKAEPARIPKLAHPCRDGGDDGFRAHRPPPSRLPCGIGFEDGERVGGTHGTSGRP